METTTERSKKSKGTILAADDDRSVRHLLKVILESEGYKVISVTNGQEVLDFTKEMKSHKELKCILLDVQMPVLNGIDTLRALRDNAHTSKIPIILLTCQSSSDDILTGYNIGADYYITKPFTKDQIVYALEIAS